MKNIQRNMIFALFLTIPFSAMSSIARLDASIPLSVRTPNVYGAYQNAQNNALRNQLLRSQIKAQEQYNRMKSIENMQNSIDNSRAYNDAHNRRIDKIINQTGW